MPQSYKYQKKKSILNNLEDEYELSLREYYELYSFYVTFSMCGTQSEKKRSFIDYGWATNTLKEDDLDNKLSHVLALRYNKNFIFTDKDDLKEKFAIANLLDGNLSDKDTQRAVIGYTQGDNNYLKLFYRVRDGLAHGKFRLVLSSTKSKMVVIQDNNKYNVTARIILRLDTLLKFIKVIDKNGII